jgi:hypothetical protein
MVQYRTWQVQLFIYWRNSYWCSPRRSQNPIIWPHTESLNSLHALKSIFFRNTFSVIITLLLNLQIDLRPWSSEKNCNVGLPLISPVRAKFPIIHLGLCVLVFGSLEKENKEPGSHRTDWLTSYDACSLSFAPGTYCATSCHVDLEWRMSV